MYLTPTTISLHKVGKKVTQAMEKAKEQVCGFVSFKFSEATT